MNHPNEYRYSQTLLQKKTNLIDEYEKNFDSNFPIPIWGIKSPDIKTQGIKSPDIKTQGIKSPDIKTQGIKSPDIKTVLIQGFTYLEKEKIEQEHKDRLQSAANKRKIEYLKWKTHMEAKSNQRLEQEAKFIQRMENKFGHHWYIIVENTPNDGSIAQKLRQEYDEREWQRDWEERNAHEKFMTAFNKQLERKDQKYTENQLKMTKEEFKKWEHETELKQWNDDEAYYAMGLDEMIMNERQII